MVNTFVITAQTKKPNISQALYTPGIPALWKAEAGRTEVQAQLGKFSNLGRLCLKIKKGWKYSSAQGPRFNPEYKKKRNIDKKEERKEREEGGGRERERERKREEDNRERKREGIIITPKSSLVSPSS